YYLGWRVAGLNLGAAVDLDQLGEIHPAPEDKRNIKTVSAQSVSGQLKAARRGPIHLAEEPGAGGVVALPNAVSHNQLGLTVHRDEGPGVANRRIVDAVNAGLLFAADERPNLINLDILDRHVAD